MTLTPNYGKEIFFFAGRGDNNLKGCYQVHDALLTSWICYRWFNPHGNLQYRPAQKSPPPSASTEMLLIVFVHKCGVGKCLKSSFKLEIPLCLTIDMLWYIEKLYICNNFSLVYSHKRGKIPFYNEKSFFWNKKQKLICLPVI